MLGEGETVASNTVNKPCIEKCVHSLVQTSALCLMAQVFLSLVPKSLLFICCYLNVPER